MEINCAILCYPLNSALYAFKCNLKKLTTKSALSAWGQRSFGMRMPSSSLHRSCDSLACPVFPRAVFFFFSAHEVLPPILFIFMFFSVTGACSFPFEWGLMAELHCCASHGGIISIYGLAANSGSPWILQAPNLHFSDAAVNQWIVLSTFWTTGARWTVDVIIGNFFLLFYGMAESFLFRRYFTRLSEWQYRARSYRGCR